MEVFLYNSTVCRLCGEENDSGNLLYSSDGNNQNLSEVINTYLPIKVSDDGQLPRTICPGCTIQLEAMVEFMNLIINGQKVIRELFQRENEYKKSYTHTNDPEIVAEQIVYELNTADGVYQIEHPIALQVAGLDKPKRKRGRPPKKPKSPEELAKEIATKQSVENNKNEINESDGTGKRRRKTPTRFKEVVQGKELERIFKEEGVIDGDESDQENKEAVIDKLPKIPVSKEPEVIGHMETSGELVVMIKGKGRGRPKGRTRQTREQCMICGMLFSSVGRYMSHIARHGPVLYQCTQCGESFSTRLKFNDHQTETSHVGQNILQCKDVTPVERVTENSETKTENCIKSNVDGTSDSTPLAPIDNLISNVQATALPTALPDLNAVGMKSETCDGDNAIEAINVKAEANDTIEEINDPNDLSGTDLEPVDGQKKLKCNHCDKTFCSRQSKSLHIKAVHNGERPYKCGECGAAFGYPRSLSLHSISHRRQKASSAKGYACDLCGKVLNHPSSVVYHKQAAHAGQRYVCGTCGKHFRHKQLLQRHQLVHSQLRPFTCKSCNATFKTKANLINHQLLHTGIKKFSCDICKHKFAHKTSLTLHMRWHTGVKPFACKMCGKCFSQKGNLLEHERIHTGEKPYQCAWCSRRFTTSSQHRLHARRHAPDRPHACPHCGKRFASRSAWSAHVRREGGRPRCMCALCGRAFADRGALLKHLRRHAAATTTHATIHTANANEIQPEDKPIKQMSLLVPDTHQMPTDVVTQHQTDGDSEERVIYIAYDVDDTAPSLHILGHEQGKEIDYLKSLDDERSTKPSTTVTFDETKMLSGRELYGGSSLLVPQTGLEQLELEQLAEPMDSIQLEHNDQLEQLQLEEVPHTLAMEEDISQEHLPVTDEHGNPLHFTMQDGTRLAITSADGQSLQVITQDGQRIPVEINSFTDDEDGDGPETVVHHLNLQKSVESNGSTSVAHYYTLV